MSMKINYSIADIPISMTMDDPGLAKHYEAFSVQREVESELEIELIREPVLERFKGRLILHDALKWVETNNAPYSLGLYVERSDQLVHSSMEVNSNWSKARIKYILNDNEWKWKSTLPLFEILFRNRLIFQQGIVIHASAIEWQGKAIVFTAPAGTGKTTQSNLWKEYMNAVVLNGDRPALRMVDNEFFAYGTPWSGSSREYINKRAPVAALVLLEQAPENTITKLSPTEALMRIMPRFFLPYNDQAMMELAVGTIEKTLRHVPVYLLKCRPDRGAVDALYDALAS